MRNYRIFFEVRVKFRGGNLNICDSLCLKGLRWAVLHLKLFKLFSIKEKGQE